LLLKVPDPGTDESTADEADAGGAEGHRVRLVLEDAVVGERSAAVRTAVAS
jgi:hypothetical protein